MFEIKEYVPLNLAKLLFITSESLASGADVDSVHINMARFVCEQHGLYVEAKQERALATNACALTVRYDTDEEVDALMASVKRFKVYRIFKSGFYAADSLDKTRSLIDSSALNLISLLRGKAIRVISDDHALRDLFYKRAVLFNEENKFGCKFDFDEYDVGVVIRKFAKVKLIGDAPHRKFMTVGYWLVIHLDRPISKMVER